MAQPTLISSNDTVATSHTSNIPRRHLSDVPSDLQGSPYLSSPIRPLKSVLTPCSRNSQKVKRSIGVSSISGCSVSKANISSGRSTVGSLRLTSPYSASVFSLQSLNSTRSRTFDKGKQKSFTRSVLLPQEVDGLASLLGVNIEITKGHVEGEIDNDYNTGEEEYGVSDFEEDSTVHSGSAMSVDDGTIFESIAKMKTDDAILFHRQPSKLADHDIPPESPLLDADNGRLNTSLLKSKSFNSQQSSTPPQIKLPAVDAHYQRDPHNDKPMHNNRKSLTINNIEPVAPKLHSPILNSPYATKQRQRKSMKKRVTTLKKKGSFQF